MPKLLKELFVLVTKIITSLTNFLGSGGIGCVVRTNVYKLFGLKTHYTVKLAENLTIHNFLEPLHIGQQTFINKQVYFDTSAPIHIGKYCDIGFKTTFCTTSHVLESNYKTRRPFTPSKPIIIEDYVWIGCNVTILGGVTIGKGAVIGANSLVSKDIPANTLAVGTPAKVIQTFTANSTINK